MLHNPLLCIILTALISYLLGSFNTSIIVTKLIIGRDIRTIGSGNAGFTNSMRTGNKAVAVLSLLGDIIKVAAAVYIGGFLMTNCLNGTIHDSNWLLGAYVAGVFAQIGHIFPLYFGFRGGKGVLTLAAMMLFIDWRVFFISVVICWAILMLCTRTVSLSVLLTLPVFIICACIFAPAGDINLFGLCFPISVITISVSVIMSVIVIVKHSDNIKRLIAGTESKLGQKADIDKN